MANYTGRKGFKAAPHDFIITIPQQDLSKGANLTIQFDQSDLSAEEIKKGKFVDPTRVDKKMNADKEMEPRAAFSNPYLSRQDSSTNWYSKEAIDKLVAAAGDKAFYKPRTVHHGDGTVETKQDLVIGVRGTFATIDAKIKPKNAAEYEAKDNVLLTKDAPLEQSKNRYFPSKGAPDDPAKVKKGMDLLDRQKATAAASKEWVAAQKQPVNLEKAQAQADATISSVEPQAETPQATQPTLDEAAEF